MEKCFNYIRQYYLHNNMQEVAENPSLFLSKVHIALCTDNITQQKTV